jgi:hypothetical protein
MAAAKVSIFARSWSMANCAVAFQKSVTTPERLDDRAFVLIGFLHGEKGVSEARGRQKTSAAALAGAQALLVGPAARLGQIAHRHEQQHKADSLLRIRDGQDKIADCVKRAAAKTINNNAYSVLE